MSQKNADDPNGRWRTINTLAESGQGWLFIVEDETRQLAGQFVKKVLKNPKRLNRFQREISVTRALAASGLDVAAVVEEDLTGKRPYYVLPYFPDGDLRRLLQGGTFVGKLEHSLRFLENLYNLLRAVQETVAHRDLKPENILIKPTGEPVLCDFGLCVTLWDESSTERITADLEQLGSRHYIAPEALQGLRAVANPVALDVYAYGKIAYEMVSGRQLPGLALPVGEYDLAIEYAGVEWRIWVGVIADLVAHDPVQRMLIWHLLPRAFTLIRKAIDGELKNDDPDWVALRRTNPGKQRELEELCQRLRHAAIEPDVLSIDAGFRQASTCAAKMIAKEFEGDSLNSLRTGSPAKYQWLFEVQDAFLSAAGELRKVATELDTNLIRVVRLFNHKKGVHSSNDRVDLSYILGRVHGHSSGALLPHLDMDQQAADARLIPCHDAVIADSLISPLLKIYLHARQGLGAVVEAIRVALDQARASETSR